MGRRERGQGQFFYAFDLDKVVPADHLVRQIDGVLDLDWVHKELAPYCSHTGRPSIDPVLMIRMLIVGYMFAIRSERRLCSEVQVNLAYRWFCKLGIEDGIPDHSVFSRARHERFRQSDALRRVFEGVVAKCIAAGLVGGEGFSIDASLIRADAGKKKRVPGDQPIAWPQAEEASRAVREYLAVLDAAHNDEENSGEDGSSMAATDASRNEDARDVARALAKTEAFEQSRRERKKVEMQFAHMKRIFKLDRLRLRGLSGAKDEVLLTATAQNLRRLAKFLCRPPPSAAVTCAA